MLGLFRNKASQAQRQAMNPQPTLLKSHRIKKGLTQLALATRAQCSLNTVALVERGGPLSPEMAKRFAQVLDVQPEALCAGKRGVS